MSLIKRMSRAKRVKIIKILVFKLTHRLYPYVLIGAYMQVFSEPTTDNFDTSSIGDLKVMSLIQILPY